MKKFPGIFLLFPIGLILLFFASCGPAVIVESVPTVTSTSFETFTPPECDAYPCPSDSLTLTAEMAPTLDAMLTAEMGSLSDSLTMTAVMAATLDAIPSNTPPPGATIVPSVGDLGWGAVYGTIRDGVTNLPIEGATVKCEHSSYTSEYLCNGITTTNNDGIYSFVGVFFHDTDRITLIVEAPGYEPLRFEQSFFTRPDFPADLGLFPPSAGATSTPTAY
ncbi:MAG: carboxypeptidase regulatory-like domain-containing protein [Chloroflexi bacterium]|nr:carboxypeptidase regulatory-like domain-containing protein [Chloroflexota bacterium]